MATTDTNKLEADIQKAHSEILVLQERIREMEAKRQRLLKEAETKAMNSKMGNDVQKQTNRSLG